MRYNQFLDNYLVYTSNTETPEIMHLWCGLSVIAGASERRVWMDRGMFQLFPNLYVVLLGPPGVVAKTTSLGFATRLLQEAGYAVVDQVATKEKIICEMAETTKFFETPTGQSFPHSSITFSMSELNTLLTAGQDMILFLTSIWDKYDRYVYKTKTSGEFEIVNPYFNLIGAATTDWFRKAVTTEMLSTGFLARCIIVYAPQKRARIAKPTLSQDQVEARSQCLRILKSLGNMYGEIEITPEAEAYYSEWYNALPDSITTDERLSGYLERKAKTFVLKVAALISLGDLRCRVEVDDFKKAIHIFDITEPALKQCILLISSNKMAEYIRDVATILLQHGGSCEYSHLVKTTYHKMTIEELAQAILSLVKMNLLHVEGKKVSLVSKVQGEKFLYGQTNE